MAHACSNNENKIKMKQLEDGILEQLANAQGDLLENIQRALAEQEESLRAQHEQAHAKIVEQKQRAAADAVDDAMDNDDPKAALIDVIVQRVAAPPGADAQLRQELAGLRLKALRARARAEEVPEEAMAAALDSEDPKQAFVELLLRHSS